MNPTSRRRKRSLALLGAGAVCLALIPAPASANIYIPSFVQVLTAPLPYSLLGYTLPMTVPVLLGVAALEARVLRRRLKHRRLGKLLRDLLVINAITSILGCVFMPRGTEMWPGIPLAFAATTVAEALLLAGFYKVTVTGLPLRSVFALSLRMNTASYAALTTVLVGLVYLPVLGNEDAAIRRGLRGTIMLTRFTASVRQIDLGRRPLRLSSEQELDLGDLGYLAQCVPSPGGGLVGVTGQGKLVRLDRNKSRWSVRRQALWETLENCKGVSANGRYACFLRDEGPVLYDLQARRVIARIPLKAAEVDAAAISTDGRFVVAADGFDVKTGANRTTNGCRSRVFDTVTRKVRPLGEVWGPATSPAAPVVAWHDDRGLVLLDLETGHRRRIPIKGSILGGIAWSPDGGHIAYSGHPNPFTAQHWSPDVRVVDTRTGRSVTIWRGLFTSGAHPRITWLPG